MTSRSLHFFLPAIAIVLTLPAAGQGTPAVPPTAQSVDTYQIDAVHSSVAFKVRHLISKVPGHFATYQGKVMVDTKDITRSSVDVTIDAASISTGVDGRDTHLKGPQFFDVAKFPTLSFKSTAVKEVSKGMLEVTGTFTMHGVAKTITIPVTNLGTTAGMKPGSVVAGFEATLKLNRSDYGMGFMVGPLGDEVDISLNIEAGKVN